MSKLELLRPTRPEQVCELLRTHNGEAVLHAGGTDLVVRINKGYIAPGVIIDLGRLENLAQTERLGDGGIRIGCLVRIAELLNVEPIRTQYQALHDGLKIIGSVQIRNRATVVGNLCNASPAADTVPPLMVLGARVNIRGAGGRRGVAIDRFFTGPGQTALAPDEFVESIDLPPPAEDFRSTYLRLGRRNAVDCAIVGVAVALDPQRRVRVAFGSVAPTSIRARALEKALDRSSLTPAEIAAAAELIDGIIAPINDVRASQEYRRAVARILFVRALRKVLHQPPD